MKVAIFGATGRTGTRVLRECERRQFACTALVRTRARLRPVAGINIVEGDARSPSDVQRTMRNADAVLCCLGMDDVAVPTTDFSDSVRTITEAMELTAVSRIVAIASAGVLDGLSCELHDRFVVPAYLKNVAAEHVRNYTTLRTSRLTWSLMCPGFLKNDIVSARVAYRFEAMPPGSDETGYQDLAEAMVALLNDTSSFRKRVGIVSYRSEN